MSDARESRRGLPEPLALLIALGVSACLTSLSFFIYAFVLVSGSGDSPGPRLDVYYPAFVPMQFLAVVAGTLGLGALIFRLMRRGETDRWVDGSIVAGSAVLGFIVGVGVGAVLFQDAGQVALVGRSVFGYGVAVASGVLTYGALQRSRNSAHGPN